jgi:outer membrane protein assembly factor BamE
MQIKIILINILLALSLTHCASYDFSRRVIQQGNLLPQSKIERLKPGMSKEDVVILMGSSLLNPPFEENRWDYAFTWRRGSGATTQRHLVLYFKNDRLARIERG